MKDFLFTCWHGTWSCGCENWAGKPKLSFESVYYDGFHYVLHIGPLWVEVDN